MIRAVLDPGVLVAAVISPAGSCAVLLRAWSQGSFELIVSEHLLAELSRVLARPKLVALVPPEDAADLVLRLRLRGELSADPPNPARICRDPGDDYLFALARSAAADVLVSGDRDVLAVRTRPPSVTPATFRHILGLRP